MGVYIYQIFSKRYVTFIVFIPSVFIAQSVSDQHVLVVNYNNVQVILRLSDFALLVFIQITYVYIVVQKQINF